MEAAPAEHIIEDLDEYIHLNETHGLEDHPLEPYGLTIGARRRIHSVISVVIWVSILTTLLATTGALFDQLKKIGGMDISAMGKFVACFTFVLIFSVMTSIFIVTILYTCRPFIYQHPRERQE